MPTIVSDVLRSPGLPLQPSTRAFMEPRFGYDFGRVRVHTDRHAAESAVAVNALAYTVGDHIVFGSNQYLPSSAIGRRLLAHELSHVTHRDEQRPSQLASSTSISRPTDPLERLAEAEAAQVTDASAVLMRQVGDAGGGDAGTSAGEQRRASPDAGDGGANDGGGGGADAGSGAAAPPAAPAFVCGPDVTQPLKDVVAALRSDYASWSSDPHKQEEACWALEHVSCAPDAWDIVELHNNLWISARYQPMCATTGATPHCGESVQIDSQCHFAPAANYVIFGAMCDLCNIWRATMHAAIFAHKIHWSGLDPDYAAAVRWADAGFDGWPGAASPAGDRNNCTPTCSMPYTGSFDYHWFPHHSTEGVSSECPAALAEHRLIRDTPPPTPIPIVP